MDSKSVNESSVGDDDDIDEQPRIMPVMAPSRNKPMVQAVASVPQSEAKFSRENTISFVESPTRGRMHWRKHRVESSISSVPGVHLQPPGKRLDAKR
jgi:hypothetical protein